MRRYKYLLAAPLLLPFAAAHAQENVIVVTGRGLEQTPATPAYGTVELEREQIVSSASGRIEDVLSSVAGFQQFRRSDSRSSNPSAQGVTLRALGGNATSRAQMILDGVPLADPFFGYIPFSAIAPERLETIRVTRGGGSGPFGAGALAGTIELESADARTLGGLFTGQAMINDREETELSGTLAPQIGDGFAIVSGRWDRGDGFFTTPESQRVAATAPAAFESWSASARVVQRVGDGVELQIRGLAFDDQRTLRFQGADSSSEGQDVSARLVSRGPWEVDALAYAQWRNFTNVVISSTSFARTLDQRDTPSRGFGGKLEVRPPVGGGNTLRLGADFRRSEGDLAEFRFLASGAGNGSRVAGGRNTDLGLFAENDLELGALTLTGGLRADRYTIADGYMTNVNAAGTVLPESAVYPDRSDWEVSYRAGAVFDALDTLQLRAAIYSGLRIPTLNELYRPFVVFPVTTNANAALGIERLEGYEAGIDWTPVNPLRLSVTAFQNTIENAITNVTTVVNGAGAVTERQRQNVDAIDAKGLEFAAELSAGRFSLNGTLAYTDAELQDSVVRGPNNRFSFDGNRPGQTPEWAASATASFQPWDGALFAATLRHVGDQFEDDLNDDFLPAATTVDLFAQVPLAARLSVVGRVENLFDEEIVTRNQGGSIDLGVPFTVWGGVRYGF